MKVWELIKTLSDYPAGAEVRVTQVPDGFANEIRSVVRRDYIVIEGDGHAAHDGEVLGCTECNRLELRTNLKSS